MKRIFSSPLFLSLWLVGLCLFSVQSMFADLVFNDARELTLGGNSVKLYMGQDGNRFYLDSTNTSGKPLSCEVKTDASSERGSCDDQYFSSYGSSEITIYVQVDNDQGTWKYNPTTRSFTSAVRGITDVTNSTTTNGSSSYLVLGTNRTTANISQYIDLTVRIYNTNNTLDTNFENDVRFTVSKRDNSGYYYSASSSDYVLNNSRYFFSSSDDGYVFLSNYLKFYTSGTYKVTAENSVTGKTSDVIVYVGSSDCSTCTNNDAIASVSVVSSLLNTTTERDISLTTTLRDQYNNVVSNTNNVTYTVERLYNNGRSTVAWPDYSFPVGSLVGNLNTSITFFQIGTYRIKATSFNNVIGYTSSIIVSNSINTFNRFDLSSNTTTPGKDNFTNLTIVAKDSNGYTLSSFNNRVRFQVYRRIYTSDAWTDITSSSLDNSAYRIYNTSYTFPSYNNGIATISNFIKFYSDSYDYKVTVVDDNNSNIYGELIYYIRNSSSATSSSNNTSSSVYRFAGVLSPTVPSLYSSFDVKLYARNTSNVTVTNYTNTVKISIERKILSSSTSWSNASTTYCKLAQTTYTFSYNNYGYVSLPNLARCSKKGFYRLKFTDSNNSTIYGYLYFTIVDEDDFSDSLVGFTSTQRTSVQETYRTFMSKVNERELNNSTLARSSTWENTRRNYYNKLNALTYNKSGRLRNYSTWVDAAQDFSDAYANLIR